MINCSCGSDWFVEQRLVRPAGVPPETAYPVREHRSPAQYRYICAECGKVYGEESLPEEKPAAVKAETPKVAPKRRGRPAKAAQN
jgi:hypothetical protein